jgi:hypothetical protein
LSEPRQRATPSARYKSPDPSTIALPSPEYVQFPVDTLRTNPTTPSSRIARSVKMSAMLSQYFSSDQWPNSTTWTAPNDHFELTQMLSVTPLGPLVRSLLILQSRISTDENNVLFDPSVSQLHPVPVGFSPALPYAETPPRKTTGAGPDLSKGTVGGDSLGTSAVQMFLN